MTTSWSREKEPLISEDPNVYFRRLGGDSWQDKGDTKIEFSTWEWADFDKNRIVWAENGKIMVGIVRAQELENQTELFDTNPLQFKLLTAPY